MSCRLSSPGRTRGSLLGFTDMCNFTPLSVNIFFHGMWPDRFESFELTHSCRLKIVSSLYPRRVGLDTISLYSFPERKTKLRKKI